MDAGTWQSSWYIAKVAGQSRWPFTQGTGRGRYYCTVMLTVRQLGIARHRFIKGALYILWCGLNRLGDIVVRKWCE